MDYFKIYDHFYRKAQDVSKRMIIAEMKKEKLKNRPFSTVHNKIVNKIEDYIRESFTKNLEQNFSESYSMFQKKHSYYEGTEIEKVKWILEDEIKQVFKKNQTSSYNSFIADLAIETSLKVTLHHYYDYRDYYSLIYDLDKYEYFIFKNFESIAFEDSEFYKSMLDEKYPHKVKEREQKLKMQALQSTSAKETKKTTSKDISEKEGDIIGVLDSFTDDEKFLIIHIISVLISKPSSIPLTDLMKLVRIVGTYEDLDIFLNSPRKVTSYSKVNKGVDYYQGKNQLNIIDSTSSKLSTLNIEVVKHQLLNMKHKHHQNKVNSRKF